MIIGSVRVSDKAIITHRDSYMIAPLTAVSVRRPFLGANLLMGGGFLGFIYAFFDLLYFSEILFIAVLSALIIAAGIKIGQLKLLSRDLRGSELSDAIWGHYDELNEVRARVASKLRDPNSNEHQ